MLEVKDSAIKLFGKTIPFSVVSHHHFQQQQQEILANDQSSSADDYGSCDRNPETSLREEISDKDQLEEQEQEHKENSGKEIIEDKQEDGSSKQTTEDLQDPTTSSGNTDHNPKTPSVDRETSSVKSSKNGEQSERSNSQEKTLKKPDKILPCPRCNSMDTKFCYYNNYNVNQPRHFCKKCQRYWTAGGTMRNVPIGAGRRKNKSSSVSHFRQIVISEALRTVQGNAPNGINNPSFGNNGTVLTFGSDSPLCESMPSALNHTNRTQNCVQNGFHRPEQRSLASHGGRDNRDDHSRGSLLTVSNSSGKGGNLASQDVRTRNYQGSAPQVPYFPGPPWPYPWNTPMPPPPAFYPSGFPIAFYPETTYWGCTVPGPWNLPCVSPNSSSFSQYPYSSPASATLGKHSRDGNIITPTNSEIEESSRGSNSSEKSVLVPKTLRIDDPSEAAKSSIWATLGIKNGKTNTGDGLFKGFQSNSDHKTCTAETSAVLQANPAALSRSLKFHETT